MIYFWCGVLRIADVGSLFRVVSYWSFKGLGVLGFCQAVLRWEQEGLLR
jgi:hypothetical protein